jgi:hypothetical protein
MGVSYSARDFVDATNFGFWITPMIVAWFLIVGYLELAVPSLSVPIQPKSRNIRRGLTKMAILFLIWLLLAMPLALTADMDAPVVKVAAIVMSAAVVLASCGFVLALLVGTFGFDRQALHSIRSVDLLAFSPREALTGAAIGVTAGLILSGFYYLWCLFYNDMAYVPVYLVGYLLLGIQGGILTRGLRPKMMETKTRPNEGMRLSLRNAILVSPTLGIGTVITVAILATWARGIPLDAPLGEAMTNSIDVVRGGETDNAALAGGSEIDNRYTVGKGWRFAAGAGAITSFFCFFWFGGFELLKHTVLRIVLAATAQLPWRLTSFLDDATRLKLLQRVGGGYMFLHRMLGEHFAKETDAAES